MRCTASILLVATAILGASAAMPPELPPPYATPSATHYPVTIGWASDQTPTAPRGFTVARWAVGLDYPRWLHVLPNGDVLVAEARTPPKEGEKKAAQMASRAMGPSANRISLLRDADGDGRAEARYTYRDGLRQPFGIARVGDRLYVGVTDALLRFRWEPGATQLTGEGERILELPAGGYNNHWTRNVVPSPDGKTLYVTVGSASNVGEHGMAEEHRRAAILAVDLDGEDERVVAGGLRNPNGIDFEPTTGAMWTAVNERDGLGDQLPPDYVTRVRDGDFYGWPWAYFGAHPDPRHPGQRPDLVARSRVPDLATGAHTATMSLLFYRGDAFPVRYRGGMFIGQHGSWNRSRFAGYRVAFVPFAGGAPAGPLEDFLTGFVADPTTRRVHGRPCGLAVLPDGSLLVADDAGDIVWRVAAAAG